MAKVRINGEFNIEARFSFSVEYPPDPTMPLKSIEGVLVSSSGYMPDIRSIENGRYLLTGVYVYAEDYGSDEDEIVYRFRAKSYSMDTRLQEVKTVG